MINSIVSLYERPDLLELGKSIESEGFPEFLLRDEDWARAWPLMTGAMADAQIFVLSDAGDLLAVGNSVLLNWDGDATTLPGFQGSLRLAVSQQAEGVPPNTLCFVQALATAEAKGRGISRDLIIAMRKRTEYLGLHSMIAAVRPTLKQHYPLASLEQYLNWRTADGRIFDPWVRVQESIGAEKLCIAPDSTTIVAPVQDWEEMIGFSLPETGDYVIPGGHALLSVDIDRNSGRYAESHVWYRY